MQEYFIVTALGLVVFTVFLFLIIVLYINSHRIVSKSCKYNKEKIKSYISILIVKAVMRIQDIKGEYRIQISRNISIEIDRKSAYINILIVPTAMNVWKYDIDSPNGKWLINVADETCLEIYNRINQELYMIKKEIDKKEITIRRIVEEEILGKNESDEENKIDKELEEYKPITMKEILEKVSDKFYDVRVHYSTHM